MAYTSVKISADSSSYQSQMKSAASQMKVLSAEYTTAATKAGRKQTASRQKPNRSLKKLRCRKTS